MATIAELESLLKEMKETERLADQARRNSVKPIHSFSFLPVDEKYHWDKVRKNCGVLLFRLTGTITNKAAIEAVGGRCENEGAMGYLVNVTNPSNPLIVCTTGGGRIFFGGFCGIKKEDEETERIYLQLEAFLKDNLSGGDVTHIIPKQKYASD